MSESVRFRALLTLLDDPDPEIRSIARSELQKSGGARDRLLAARRGLSEAGREELDQLLREIEEDEILYAWNGLNAKNSYSAELEGMWELLIQMIAGKSRAAKLTPTLDRHAAKLLRDSAWQNARVILESLDRDYPCGSPCKEADDSPLPPDLWIKNSSWIRGSLAVMLASRLGLDAGLIELDKKAAFLLFQPTNVTLFELSTPPRKLNPKGISLLRKKLQKQDLEFKDALYSPTDLGEKILIALFEARCQGPDDDELAKIVSALKLLERARESED